MSSDEYDTKYNNMISRFRYTKYIFDVHKICGYNEFIAIDKDDTLTQMYKIIARHFEMSEIENLYLRNEETKEFKRIPNTDMTVRYFVSKYLGSDNLRNFVKPIYPEPAQIVYRVFFDDANV
jgi:hypothetical protein